MDVLTVLNVFEQRLRFHSVDCFAMLKMRSSSSVGNDGSVCEASLAGRARTVVAANMLRAIRLDRRSFRSG